jgi:hypothetical protein
MQLLEEWLDGQRLLTLRLACQAEMACQPLNAAAGYLY